MPANDNNVVTDRYFKFFWLQVILQKKEQAIVTILLDSKRILKNKANVANINSVGNIKSSAQENKNPMCAFFQSFLLKPTTKQSN